MRVKKSNNGVTVHAISGTHVVTFGFDTSNKARKKLLGFAINREDHTEGEKYWLSGFKTFKETTDEVEPGSLHSTLFQPIQTYIWGDYTAKPNHTYTFTIRPVYGKPKNLKYGKDVLVKIKTESEDDGKHGIYFNRGAIASQYYAKKFGSDIPDVLDLEDKKTKWLSRGLLEAALRFIRQAKDENYALKVAAYELDYDPILIAFKKAKNRGVKVQIVYEGGNTTKTGNKETSTTKRNKKKIRELRIKSICYPRTKRPSIPHNKFIILEKNNIPIEVWTGSTNFTSSGFLGQSNVGHIVRDEKLAARFEEYWQKLKKDIPSKELKQWNKTHSPTPIGDIKKNATTLYFSPRARSKMINWYSNQIQNIKQTLLFTAAFGVSKQLAPAFLGASEKLRFILMEKKLSKSVSTIFKDRREIIIAKGELLGKKGLRYKIPGWNLDKWFLEEEHYRKRGHVFYVHTKFLLLDILTDDPKIFTGSANFSYNSLMSNDENMLLIRGNKRVADIYLGEFMRLFSHFYFRSIANKLASEGRLNVGLSTNLKSDDSWTNKHFKRGTYSYKRRILFR